MDFGLNAEQKLLIQTVRRFIAQELKPLEEQIETSGILETHLAKQIFDRSYALGLYATNIPSQYGGGGLDAVTTMLLEEQFGHVSDILIRRAFGNVYEALLGCQDAQLERWLLPCVRGERTCSIAITEPNAGSDAASIQTKAVPDGTGWRLSGAKHFVSDGLYSDFFIVSAQTQPTIHGKISLFLVDKNTAGVQVGRDQAMMGLRGTSHVELFFNDVPLEPLCLLGEQGQGFKIMLETLGRVRLAQVGARAVGKACAVQKLTLEYARERQQFGQPIGNFQLVQQMLADSTIEINAARLLVLNAADALDKGLAAREQISMVKVFAAETLGRVVDRAVQIFGGMGFCKQLPIERYYRDARIYRIFDGTSEIHRIQVAKAALKGSDGIFEIGAR